jgi:hypothetical protein
MRKILTCAAMAAMIALAWNSDGAAAAVAQTKAPAKTTAGKKKAVGHKSTTSAASGKKGATTATTKTASARGKKAPVRRGVNWRNRQMAPTADRYREIQGALAAKGFLQPQDATGTWNQASTDALKKFQADQNLESSGKINSLSLIALGLGPHRDLASPSPKPAQPPIQ